MRNQAAGARLGGRDRETALAEQPSHGLLHGHGTFTVAVGAYCRPQPIAYSRQALRSGSGLAVRHDAHRDLREAGAERHPALGGIDDARDQLVEARLGDTEGLERACQVDVAATLRPQPWQHRLLHHRLHLARDARQHDDGAAAVRDAVARRRSERVRHDHRAGGHERLLQVVLGHRATGCGEETPDAVGRHGVLDQRNAEDAGDGLAGEVVGSGPDAAGRDHDVRLRDRLAPRPREPLGPVAHREHADDIDADLEQLVGDPARVGVDDAPGGELVAGRQEGGALDHATARTTRAAIPAYAPATRSSPTTPSPDRTRRSMRFAGHGFSTSRARKSTKTSAAAVHVPGTKRPATIMPATSSMTMQPWSCPGSMPSARSAAQKAIASSVATTTQPASGARVRSVASAGSSGSATSEPSVPDPTGA